MGARLISLILLIAAWYAGSQLAGARLLPDPEAVALAIVDEARSGALAFNLGATLARVAVAFTLAMALGSVIGLVMGRSRLADRLGDPWLIVLLNLPALVIIVLAYVWAGLTETAAIAAVALNKLPIATVTVREGARSLDRALDDMAEVFRMGAWTRMRHVILPQLAPLSRRRCPLRPVPGLEDRAHCGTARAPERRRLRDRRRVPIIRRHPYPGLCSRLRRRHAGDRNVSGAAA